MTPPEPPPLTATTQPKPLSASERAEAEALYRQLMAMWAAGTRRVLVTHHEDRLSVGAVGRRMDLPPLPGANQVRS